MEYFDLVKTILVGLVAIVVITLIVLRKKRQVKLNSISLGPFSAEIIEENVSVDKIDLQSTPIAGCVGEVLSPPLKIRLQDSNGYPVKNKKVRIELFDENGLLSSKNYCGQTSKTSDQNGFIIFNDLILKKTGRICIFICVDGIETRTEDIDVLPPGLNLDFWNEVIGSPQYEEKLNRALRMSGNNQK